jgi:hypothetical protein
MEAERPPICPACGVTMLPAELTAEGGHESDWVCVECEEAGDPEGSRQSARTHRQTRFAPPIGALLELPDTTVEV